MESTTIDELVVALRTRADHEFFAGLPSHLDRADAELLAELKTLAYAEHGPTKRQWLRLTYQAREALRHYSSSPRRP